MTKLDKYLMKIVVSVDSCGSTKYIADLDRPPCFRCGKNMEFHGGDDVPYGEAEWVCKCGFSFSENDLSPYYDKYFEDPWEYDRLYL